MDSTIEIGGYRAGALGRIVQLHAEFYSQAAGFGSYFECKVAAEMADFLRAYDPSRDGLWVALDAGRVEGAVAIQGTVHGAGESDRPCDAQLRWFIVSDALRGRGAGQALLTTALDQCRRQGLRRIALWTFAGLHAARHLYEKHGFRLVEEREGEQWGSRVREQRFLLEVQQA